VEVIPVTELPINNNLVNFDDVMTEENVGAGILLGIPLREWVLLIRASFKVISRQTSKDDIPKTFETNRTNLRGNLKFNSNLIQNHLRQHLRF
jgi:hypothetical protein